MGLAKNLLKLERVKNRVRTGKVKNEVRSEAEMPCLGPLFPIYFRLFGQLQKYTANILRSTDNL